MNTMDVRTATRAVESVYKTSDTDSFIKAQYVLYDDGKPTEVKKVS
jgi:hypothetical protein